MKSLTAVAIASAISVLAPHPAHAASLPPEVLGTWGLSEAAVEVVAPNCRSVTFQFDPTTVTETHDGMVLKTTYEVVGEGPPWTLRQVIEAYNARPNCIGTVMPLAPGQHIPHLRIDIQGDRLRLHLRERRGSPLHLDLVRSGLASGTANGPRPGSPAP